MTSSSPLLHAGPAVGFDQPFEMLVACQVRMVRTLSLLERLGAHVQQQGCDEQARNAAADVLRYFDVAAPQHHMDEELHVLPRLRVSGHAAMAARLMADHQVMELDWAQLRPDLQAVIDGRLGALEVPPARARWTQFATLYRRHLAAEERHAFPSASQGLSSPEQRAMGAEMAQRRGAPSPPVADPLL